MKECLVVIDCQTEFYENNELVRKNFPVFPQNVSSLLRYFREAGNPIVHIAALYSVEKSKFIPSFTELNPNKSWRTKGKESISSWATPENNEKVFEKPTFSAFQDTSLESYLTEIGVEVCVVAGMMASSCVLHTCLDAFARGFKVKLVKEATADRTVLRQQKVLELFDNYTFQVISIHEAVGGVENYQKLNNCKSKENDISTFIPTSCCYQKADVPKVILKAQATFGEAELKVGIFHDLNAIESVCYNLINSFPENWIHSFAIKSNPVSSILKLVVSKGVGLETASLGELAAALQTDCKPSHVVFDSPAKTKEDLEYALRYGVRINADNFSELERIDEILKTNSKNGLKPSSSVIGLRVNPLCGAGKIAILSTAARGSKFGVPLSLEGKKEILSCFIKYPFLSALHVHVGSQGIDLSLLVKGINTISVLAQEIDSLLIENGQPDRFVHTIDIGGGLPVDYYSDTQTPTFVEYCKQLKEGAPSLFAPLKSRGNIHRTVITEFGKAIIAKTAFALCPVEYVKNAQYDDNDNNNDGDGKRIVERCTIILQAGADLFMRTCYNKQNFPLPISYHAKSNGEEYHLNNNDNNNSSVGGGSDIVVEGDVAGPLCFSGDKLVENTKVPRVLEAGDYVVCHNVGANTLSLWSKHCSRLSPGVYGYRLSAEGTINEIFTMKEKERLEDMLKFWG